MKQQSFRNFAAAAVALVFLAASCGGEDATTDASADDRPTVVVTTNILGDVVENLVGDEFDVVTIMPVGTDPHDFQASAQEVAEIGNADVVIVNGGDFEEGLLDVIESAEADGVPVFEAMSAVEPIEFGADGHGDEHGDEDDHDEHGDEEDHDEHGDEDDHDEHGDEEDHDEHGDEDDHDEHGDEDDHDEHGDEDDHDEHGDEDDHDEHGDEDDHDEHGDEDDHDEHGHDGVDPHFFTDPARVAVAADEIVDFLIANVDGVDAEALEASAAEYIAELEALDAEVEELLGTIPEERRVLVTNHEVFGYFADRYGFEVVGTVIPSGTTVDGANAQELAELAEIIEHEGVPAIFADTSSSDELAATVADEVGSGVEIVELFSESLGADDSEGATYVDMVRTNAGRIAEALSN